MATAALISFYVLFPVLVIYVCQKFPTIDKIGDVIICYAAGIIIGNVGILPGNSFKIIDTIMTATIPLALPLLFFSLDIKKWSRLAGKTLLSMLLAVIAITITSCAGYLIFKDTIPDNWKIAGMLVGVYTGGTMNMAAIGAALRVDPTTFIMVQTADVLMSAIYMLFLMTVGQRVFLWVLPAFKKTSLAQGETTKHEFTDYTGMFTRRTFFPLLFAFFLSALICAVSAGVTFFAVPKTLAALFAGFDPKQYGLYTIAIIIIGLTTLGIAASLIPKIRNINKTFQLGMYIILIFCTAVGSLADITKLGQMAPGIMAFVTFCIFVTLLIHVLLSIPFKIDADTTIVVSTSTINSPPFVPVVAGALKNKEVVFSGVTTGIIGYAAGNYLGITLGYLYRAFFP